jgi:hypothetical protein
MFAFMGSYGVGPNSASGSAAHIGESCLSSVTEASGRRAGHDDHRDREQLPRTGSVSVIARISWRRECHPSRRCAEIRVRRGRRERMNEHCLRLENARILDVYGENSRVGGLVPRGPGHCRSRRPDVVGLVLSAEAAPMHDATFNWSYVRLTPEVTAAMKQLALEQRRLLGSRAPWHVGDLAWRLRQHEGREGMDLPAVAQRRPRRRVVMAEERRRPPRLRRPPRASLPARRNPR